jgi:uncharacterized repeat protein (TIGR03943 family)
VAWALFFLYLWASGEHARYAGPRTSWVVPFGFLALLACAVLHGLSLRVARTGLPRRVSPGLRVRRPNAATMGFGEAAALLVILAPILTVWAVPDAALGSLALARREGSQEAAGFAAADKTTAGGRPSLLTISAAGHSEEYAASHGVRVGAEVALVGFVVDEEVSRRAAGALPGGAPPAGYFEIGRFVVACCAADAIPYAVEVDAGGVGEGLSPARLATDSWVRVRGELGRRGEEFVVVAEEIERIPEPDRPYIRAGS